MKFNLPQLLVVTLLTIISLTAFAQDKKDLDRKAIKSMAGCYHVNFKYTETFAPEVDYEKAFDYSSSALEWAEVIEETDDKIVIQHLLLIERDSADPYIIKHWRQDWIFEADKEFTYNGDRNWHFKTLTPLESKGKWTQNVYQVDDSPRYSGTATWTHVDGISSWFNRTFSPLPRREYSTRHDYNVMKRGNRVQIMDYGWLHEQDNDKIIRTDSTDILLAQEKGYNTYVRSNDSECKMARSWWQDNKEMWTEVRNIWDDTLDGRTELKLAGKVEDKRLYEHLFDTERKWSEHEINNLIHLYIVEKESRNP